MEHKESSKRNTPVADNLALFELLLKGAYVTCPHLFVRYMSSFVCTLHVLICCTLHDSVFNISTDTLSAVKEELVCTPSLSGYLLSSFPPTLFPCFSLLLYISSCPSHHIHLISPSSSLTLLTSPPPHFSPPPLQPSLLHHHFLHHLLCLFLYLFCR